MQIETFGSQVQYAEVRGPRATGRRGASGSGCYNHIGVCIICCWGGGLSHSYGIYKHFYPLIRYNRRFGIINENVFEERFSKARG